MDKVTREILPQTDKEEQAETVNQVANPSTNHDALKHLNDSASNVNAVQAPLTLRCHLRKSFEYRILLALTLASIITVYLFSDFEPTFLRYSFGLLLVLCLPGYSLVRALFPSRTLTFENKSSLDSLLTVAFSIVFSIIIVSLVGLALDFTPWGLRLNSLTLSLSLLTIFFAIVAMLRTYKIKKLLY